MSRINEALRLTGGGLEVYQDEAGPNWKPGRNFQNPFLSEKQETPSFNIYEAEAGIWRHNDFATGDSGDCIDFVMKLHGLRDTGEALAYIEQKLNLPSATGERPQPFQAQRLTSPLAASVKLARPFNPVFREVFTIAELGFWQRPGIDTDILTKFGVRALESYTATRTDGTPYTVRATADNPLFAYDAGNGFWKVYAPLAEKKYKFTWPTGQPSGYKFGFAQLPEWSPCILIAAGEKDAMTLSAHGYPAVTVGSEAAPVSKELVALLKGRCDEVLICYDADATGQKRAAELSAEHGLRWVELPAELAPYGKDATDFYQAAYEGKIKPELLQAAVGNARIPEPEAKPKSAAYSTPTRLRTAAERVKEAQNSAPLRGLFGPLWESPSIGILAGEPGAAKTLLALHIAHAVSSSTPHLLGLSCDSNERTLYYDLELTDRQFEKRLGRFPFTDNLIIGDYNPDGFNGAFTFAHIVADVKQTRATLLIIDNITALSMKSTADADAAMSIMRGLKDLQRTMGISSLVIAHPPKLPVGIPLSLNHIGGSKHITNFADSVFFIARSEQGPNIRYIKQVKNRTGEQLPGVLVCEIQESETGLGFTLIGPDEERNHLAQLEGVTEKPESESAADVAKLRELWRANPTTPQAALAKLIGRSTGWVNKQVQRFRAEPTDVHASVHGIHAHPGTVNAVNVNEQFKQAA